MEPISSATSARATASQPPIPAQQRRDDEALTAPQPRADSFTASAPGQDVQLQRRQVVEELGKNQQVTEQLRGADEQLRSARDLAQQASASDLTSTQRDTLNQRFDETRSRLNELADSAREAGFDQNRADRLRVNAGIGNAQEARETTRTLDSAITQVGNDLGTLAQQSRVLGADFPRTTQKNNVAPAVRSEQDASNLARQLQRELQNQPATALSSQASNTSRQTALTLFQ